MGRVLKLNNESSCFDFLTKEKYEYFLLINDIDESENYKPKSEWTIAIQDNYGDYIFEVSATKENYINACRRCKELFLGGKDE